MEKNGVVITGVGGVTSIGQNIPDFWKNCLAGRCGISVINREGTELFTAHNGGQIVNFNFENILKKESTYDLGRATQLLITSMREAIEDSMINKVSIDKVLVGTTMGETTIDFTIRNSILGKENQASDLRKNQVKNILADAMFELNLSCENMLLCNACSAGNYSLVTAFEYIRNGDIDVAIVGGVDAFSTTAYYGFSRLSAVASDMCKPFDKDRDGMLVAEGSACLVLESKSHAIRRNANIYAEMIGYGISSDAFHINAPHPEGKGIRQATAAALRYSDISADEIDYISAHGTGTIANDKIESKVLSEIFGNRKVPISSIKSMIGHTMGAASALEAIVCCLAIRDGKIPPTINFEKIDENCPIYCVPNNYIDYDVTYALNNSYAFGGSNATTVFRKYQEEVK